jgi:peptidoglycan hydrolase-like protein with peptidoglycan-binding domain
MAYLVRGVRGEPVKALQEKLGIEADGIFGAGTEKAVKGFQSDKGLSVDGVVGPDTFAAAGLVDYIILERGTKGECVKKLQTKLGIGADGIFGGGTEKAVKAFQSESSLPADGVVGPKTLEKLDLPGVGTPTGAAVAARWDELEEDGAGAFERIKKIHGG